MFDFSARLSKENGWSREFTSRVIQEYKRFLLLAMHAGHPVTPSEAVDQVWHLHLVYTRSYWQVLCGQILGRPLHHEPTKGGAMEGGKFREQYQRTLESYRRLFGEEPPTDVWTSVEHCFRPKTFRWVDVSRRWLLPKPAWITRMRPRHVMSAAILIVMAAMLVGCDDLDVFDYRGEAFLLFYGYGFAIAMVTSFLLARVMAGIVWTPVKDQSLSDPYEIALLGGGARRVLDAALAALFARKMLEVQTHGSQSPATLHRVPDVMVSQMHPVEEKVLNALPQDLRSLLKLFQPVAEKLRANLEAAGWMLTNSQRSQFQLITAVPMVLMMLVGTVKVFVGLERDKPVMFLVFALLVSLILTIVILSKVRRRTISGDAEWKRLARPTTAPRLTSTSSSLTDIGGLAAMAVAVTGVQALAGSGYESLYQTIRHPQATSSSGCGSSGCSTSGCGGGDSGGSGCSSGCGGCGGGGD